MTDYDKLYYIAVQENLPGTIALKPDKETSDRFFESARQQPGRPFHFSNGFRDEMAAAGIRERITDVLFSGPDFMVKERIYQLIADFEIRGLQYYPAVYESDLGQLHDYWFLIFEGTEGRDWYDRQRSVIEDEEDLEEDDDPFIEGYALDAQRLSEIPEEERLMFNMTGVMTPQVFVHQRIVDVFLMNQASGIRFIRVCDYEDGMEFRR